MMKPSNVKLTMPYVYLLGGTGSLCVLLLLLRFCYLPVIFRIGERRAALQELRVKMVDVQRVRVDLPKQEAALRRAEERYRTLEKRLGHGQSVARILEELNELAKHKRVQLVATQSSIDEREGRLVTLGPDMILREVPLTVQLTGRYRQMAEFLGALDDAPFIASVQRLHMTKAQRDGYTLQADLALAVYLAERMPSPR